MDADLTLAQALRFAEEFSGLHAAERAQRHAVEETLARLRDSYATTVRVLAAALEMRDDVTGGHAGRVASLALRLAHEVAPELADDPELEFGFLLHDIGKIGIPDAVLLKPGRLTPEEFAQMRRHTLLGDQLVSQVPFLCGIARDVVVAHHERWDGGGYPFGLAGTAIPLAARIFAVVDAFDAMTNDRPYRRALSVDAALAELHAGAGAQFDPDVTAAFTTMLFGGESAA